MKKKKLIIGSFAFLILALLILALIFTTSKLNEVNEKYKRASCYQVPNKLDAKTIHQKASKERFEYLIKNIKNDFGFRSHYFKSDLEYCLEEIPELEINKKAAYYELSELAAKAILYQIDEKEYYHFDKIITVYQSSAIKAGIKKKIVFNYISESYYKFSVVIAKKGLPAESRSAYSNYETYNSAYEQEIKAEKSGEVVVKK